MIKSYRQCLIAIHKARESLALYYDVNDHEGIHRAQTALIELYQVQEELLKEREGFKSSEGEEEMSKKNEDLIWVQWGADNEAVVSREQYESLCRAMDDDDFATHTAVDVDPSMKDLLGDLLSEYSKLPKLRVS